MKCFIDKTFLVRLLTLVLALSLCLTGCGTTTPTNATDNGETTQATQETTEATEPVEETTAPTAPEETEAPIEPATEATEATEPGTDQADDTVYTAVEETVYATTTVNLRAGAGTSFGKRGTLSWGDSVTRTGIGNNGWSRVLYNGEEVYAYSAYLSTKKPVSSGASSGNSGSSGGSTSGSSGNSSSSGGNAAASAAVQFADPSTGISWDGVSPIIYTYADGTTGTTPVVGASYEIVPGRTTTYSGISMTGIGSAVKNEVFYCDHCGKVSGDGSNGTCIRWSFVGGDHTCPCCGTVVPEHTCHTCDED